MKRASLLSALIFGLFAVSGAQAETASPAPLSFAVAADAGSTGVGLYGVLPVSKSFNARLGIHGGDYSYDRTKRGVPFEVKLKAEMFDALLDYYPVEGPFRLTAGLVYNNNSVDFATKSGGTGTYTLNGKTYTITNLGEVTGSADFRKVAPYLGFGFGNALKEKGFSFTSDIGLLFQGDPSTRMVSSGCTASASVCNQFAGDLSAENKAFHDRVADYRVLPVLRVGVTYRF